MKYAAAGTSGCEWEPVGVSGTFKETTRSPCSHVEHHLEHTCPDGQGGQIPFHIAQPDTSTTSVAELSLRQFQGRGVRPSVQPGGGWTRTSAS